jgi:hypothetical protein
VLILMSHVVVVREKDWKKKKKKKKKQKKEHKKDLLGPERPTPAADFEKDLRVLEETRKMNERLMTTENHNVDLWLKWVKAQEQLLGHGEAVRVRQQAVLEQGSIIWRFCFFFVFFFFFFFFPIFYSHPCKPVGVPFVR